jgi:hypothetical protein
MNHLNFQEPVGRRARSVPTVDVGNSIAQAAERMLSAGIDIIPVTQEGTLKGVIRSEDLVGPLADDRLKLVGSLVSPAQEIYSFATGAEALRMFEKDAQLIVVDADRRVVGLLTPLQFYAVPDRLPRPPMVGGMATPFGVYLTNGSVSAGKGGWALVSTGSFLFLFFCLARIVGIPLSRVLPDNLFWNGVLDALPLIFLISVFRFLPIAGYHGAEHQVVHAIEQGEDLDPEIVAEMPRVHPRCGTNLAVGATLFLTILETPWVKDHEIRLLVAMLVTLFFWRPLGSFVQKNITTRPANQKQLQSGIDAANELLEKYAIAERRQANPFRRIINSGMLHVMSGSILAYLVLSLIAMAFGVPFGSL